MPSMVLSRPNLSTLCSLLFLLGTVAIGAELTPLQVGGGGRLLTDAAGKPVFLLGDTAWSLALRLTREEAEQYLLTRQRQRFNAVTFVLFSPGRTELTSELVNAYGDAPFELVDGRPDPTRPLITSGGDPRDAQQYDYWDHVDQIVALTRRFGFYTIMLPTWGTGVAGSYDGKDTREIIFNAENARIYGTWLAQRYRAEPHVMWMLGGDRSAVYGEKDYRPVFRALAGGLAAVAPAQLISYHPRKLAPQSADWFHDDPWLAFNSNQEWPENQVRNIAADWARTPPKPTWLFEGRYEGYWKNKYKPEDWGEWQTRQQAYQTVFAGAFGHTYGHERVFGFGQDQVDWKQYLDTPGARSMTHLAKLMAHFTAEELLTRSPAPSLVAGDAGKPERTKSNYIVATRAAAGTKAMVYSASGRPVRVNLDRLAAGRLFASWFNPRNGNWHRPAGKQASSTWFARDIASGPGAPPREFVPPTNGDGEDWVLVLSAREMTDWAGSR